MICDPSLTPSPPHAHPSAVARPCHRTAAAGRRRRPPRARQRETGRHGPGRCLLAHRAHGHDRRRRDDRRPAHRLHRRRRHADPARQAGQAHRRDVLCRLLQAWRGPGPAPDRLPLQRRPGLVLGLAAHGRASVRCAWSPTATATRRRRPTRWSTTPTACSTPAIWCSSMPWAPVSAASSTSSRVASARPRCSTASIPMARPTPSSSPRSCPTTAAGTRPST